MDRQPDADERLQHLIEAVHQLAAEQYAIELEIREHDLIDQLALSLQQLAQQLADRRRQLQRLDQITANINAGLLLDDILDHVYYDFREIVPYNRIGFSLIENGQIVRARWARSDQPEVYLTQGYSARLVGSSLQTIIETGQPRIINDLVAYLAQKPHSDSTRQIVQEGMRSSLTCPLIVEGYPIGFMFFSSIEPHTYSEQHVAIFQRIARQLSIIVDKGNLVSAIAQRQGQIEDQNETLRRLDDLKTNFLGMVAHDLRNPIGYILASAEMMRNPRYGVTAAQRGEMLNEVVAQCEHMLALINDLLDVAQFAAGKLVLILAPIYVEEFLAGAVTRYTPAASVKSIDLVLEAADDGQVRADPTRLRQVIDNLISNAIKFSPPNTTIRVRGQLVGDHWRLAVQDEGPGITAADRAHLFQDFARLSAQPTGGEKSTGLGLAITRRIVEAHGGVLGVDSEPGQGATFWFTLPVNASP